MNLLDNDLYKFFISQQIRKHYPGVWAEFRFQVRSGFPNCDYVAQFDRLTDDQLSWLNAYLDTDYVEWLARQRFTPPLITARGYAGPWEEVTLWEIPLLAAMARREEPGYFNLPPHGLEFTEIGTRRACSFAYQKRLVAKLLEDYPHFRGTSNCQIAMDLRCQAVGSMPHEWIMGVSGLDSIQNANEIAAAKWAGVSDCFLPDTFGIAGFLKNEVGLQDYRAIRHDSGSHIVFVDVMRKHYPNHEIRFTNSVAYDHAEALNRMYGNVSFGFGGALTNPEPGRLEAVIKLWAVDGFNVVKLSDDPGKEFGEPKMVEAVKRIYA